jgi:hypothetical protein
MLTGISTVSHGRNVRRAIHRRDTWVRTASKTQVAYLSPLHISGDQTAVPGPHSRVTTASPNLRRLRRPKT